MTTPETPSNKSNEQNDLDRLDAFVGGIKMINHFDAQATGLTTEELEVLQIAKKANGKYFAAVIDAAKVMKNRRDKYSGADPYDNFKILLYVMGIYFKNKYNIDIDLRDVFMYYHSQKFARLMVSGSKDFGDESAADTRRDAANYMLIDEGDMLDE